MDFVDDRTLIIDKFKEAPEVIQVESLNDKKAYYLKIRFTSFKLQGYISLILEMFLFITIRQKHINESSLVKYLSSFRSEFHFHEECCEMIYKRDCMIYWIMRMNCLFAHYIHVAVE